MPDKEQVTEAEDIFEEGRGPKELQEFLKGLHKKYGHLGEKARKENKSNSPEPKEVQEVEEVEESQEILPEQGNLVGKFVDVEDRNGKRLGTGKCLREDFGPPWSNEVKMICPPFWGGKVIKDVRIKLSLTQQLKD